MYSRKSFSKQFHALPKSRPFSSEKPSSSINTPAVVGSFLAVFNFNIRKKKTKNFFLQGVLLAGIGNYFAAKTINGEKQKSSEKEAPIISPTPSIIFQEDKESKKKFETSQEDNLKLRSQLHNLENEIETLKQITSKFKSITYSFSFQD